MSVNADGGRRADRAAGRGLRVDVTVARGTFDVTTSFDARPGETIALLGPNGAGKSTVVSAIAGLARPAAGTISLGERVLDDVDRRLHLDPEARPIGIVFQDLLLFPHLSALENVAFGLRARGDGRANARAAARGLLERLGIAHRATARPRDLSGGEAQRVALARALVGSPRLLLLDEPLSALDVGTRTEVRELLATELARFSGVRILVTHDPVEASILADRLVLLEDGRVTQVGTPEEIRDAPRTRYAADLVGVNAFQGRLRTIGDDAMVVTADGGAIVVPWGGAPLYGEEVMAILRPSDVTLSLEPPSGSARNVLRGPVTSVAGDGERARVRIAATPPVVAEVTAASVARLGLRAGVEVWASFKAVEVELLTP